MSAIENVNPKALAVILTGTDPDDPRGGIATAVAGYKSALTTQGLFGGLIPTYKAGQTHGKWWPWLKAIPALYKRIGNLRNRGKTVVVFGNAGPHISIVRESLILLWARLCGACTMLQLHTPNMDRYLDSGLICFLLRVAFLPARRIVVLTPWWQRRLAEAGFHHTSVLPNCLPQWLEVVARKKLVALPATRPDSFGPNDPLRLLAMARLERDKGVHVAIEAMQFLPSNVVLDVAGAGPDSDALQALARRLGVANRVKFLGWIAGQRKREVLEAADVFCLPSRVDSFGMVFVEAMAHGKPVVTVNSRAIADVVVDGHTGLVVNPPDIAAAGSGLRSWRHCTTEIWARAIADAILQLQDPKTRYKMGSAGLRWTLDRFSADSIGRRIEQVAGKLASSNQVLSNSG